MFGFKGFELGIMFGFTIGIRSITIDIRGTQPEIKNKSGCSDEQSACSDQHSKSGANLRFNQLKSPYSVNTLI